MTIALTGGSLNRPTPIYRLIWDGTPIPHGYIQSVSDPVAKRLTATGIQGRHGGVLGSRGTDFRTVNVVVRVLSRLGNDTSGLSHLNDVLDQIREDLDVLDTNASGTLRIGDTDRYLTAELEGWDHPQALDAHRGMNLTLTFRAQPYYISTVETTASRDSASVARISGSVNGTVSYISGRFNNALLCNNSGEYIQYPAEDNIRLNAGTLAMWLKVHYGSSEATDRIAMRISGSSNYIDIGWDTGVDRFRIHGTSDSPVYAQAPAITFASGANIFLAATWNNLGTTIYVGSSSGALVTSSSANAMNGTIVSPSTLRVGGNGTQFNQAGQSDVVIFSSVLTPAQIRYLQSSSAAYDPMDTELPATMLLDLPLNSTAWANSSSNSVYVDMPASRPTYPSITLDGTGAITISHSNKVLEYSAAPNPAVTVDCATFTVIDTAGSNKAANVEHPNYGFIVSGSTREAFLTTAVSGSVDIDVSIRPRYTR